QHASMSLPVVELNGVAVHHHWLAWKDVEILDAGSGKKLAPQHSVLATILPYQGDAWFKDVASWNQSESRRELKAVPPRTPSRSSVRILASSESARATGQGRWLHEASYWIQASVRAELRVKFPAAVEAFNVWTDQRLHAALHPAANEFVLPLEADLRPRQVELRWKYAPSVEGVDGPNI